MSRHIVRIELAANHASWVWENIEPRLSVLPNANELWDLDYRSFSNNENMRRKIASLITVLAEVAFGHQDRYDHGFDGPGRNRIDQLIDINPDIYVPTVDHRYHVLLDLRNAENTSDCVIDFGPVLGFSALLPVTKHGFSRYMAGEVSMRDFDERHLVSFPYPHHSIETVFIAAAVYLPEIDMPGAAVVKKCRMSARRVFEDLFARIDRFIPKFVVHGENPESAKVVLADPTKSFPIVVCPLSHRFKGGPSVEKAGFTQDTFDSSEWIIDKASNSVYFWQPGKLEHFGMETRRRIFRTIRLFSK